MALTCSMSMWGFFCGWFLGRPGCPGRRRFSHGGAGRFDRLPWASIVPHDARHPSAQPPKTVLAPDTAPECVAAAAVAGGHPGRRVFRPDGRFQLLRLAVWLLGHIARRIARVLRHRLVLRLGDEPAGPATWGRALIDVPAHQRASASAMEQVRPGAARRSLASSVISGWPVASATTKNLAS